MQQLEYVVDTYTGFQVGSAAHYVAGGDTVTHGEKEQFAVMALVRIVFVRQGALHTTDAESFAPLQLLDKRDAVEQLSVHVIGQGERGITVVQELHVVDQAE